MEQQINYARLAADHFAGFRITGAGPYAVLCAETMTCELFDCLLLANSTGRHVHILEPKPARKPLRRIAGAFDDL